MSLYKKIDNKSFEDEPIPMENQAPQTLVIDATKHKDDFERELLDIRMRFGRNEFSEMVRNIEQKATNEEERQKKEKADRLAKLEAERQRQNDPFTTFTRLFTNRHRDGSLYQWLAKTDDRTLSELHTKLTANPRHYASILSVGDAIGLLGQELQRRTTTTTPKPRVSFWKSLFKTPNPR